MDVELILKVAGIGMIAAVICQILSRVGRDDQANLVSLTGIILILLVLAEKIGELINTLRQVFGF